MEFMIDGAAILTGGVLGHLFEKKVKSVNMKILGIGIMLISMIGVIQNMISIVGNTIQSKNLMLVVISLLMGNILGEWFGLEDKLSGANSQNCTMNALITGIVFFAVGGLQISAPIAYMIDSDSSVMVLKGMIDFPFAVALGAAYGMGIGMSGFFVLLIQLLIGLCALASRTFFSESVISQLCAIGYVILFFSGFNAFFGEKYKVSTVNLLPSIFIVIVYNIVMYIL